LAFYIDRGRQFVKRWFVATTSFALLSLFTVGMAWELYRTDFVLLWGIVACLIAITTAAAIERNDWFLNSWPMVWTGVLSYSLYLWQQPLLVFDGPLNYLSVRLIATFALAYISYRFIEQPMLRFRSACAGILQVSYSASSKRS
jgi:peptidoglycan/LPS O-acetylase OafA/YrhL